MAMATGEVTDLYGLVEVVPVAEDAFRGTPVGGPYGRVFGGQLIGQAVESATATVDAARPSHSVHAYFLRAGRADLPIGYDVERVRDGGSFSVRAVTGRQGDRVLVRATVSFQERLDGLAHQAERPVDYPDPDSLAEDVGVGEALGPGGERPAHRSFVELRRVPRALDPAGGPTGQAVWMRARRRGAEHPASVYRAALAMATDFTVLETVVSAHELSFDMPGVSVASLDHAVWWHADADLDDWVLYVQQSPWSGHERGLVSGRLYDRSGRLLASVAQEGLLRLGGRPIGSATS